MRNIQNFKYLIYSYTVNIDLLGNEVVILKRYVIIPPPLSINSITQSVYLSTNSLIQPT
jgi:hypothetical protein